MSTSRFVRFASVLGLLVGCSEAPGPRAQASTAPPTATPEVVGDEGRELVVPVPDGARVFLRLADGALVTGEAPAGDGWDLAFEGYALYTNGGASGPGRAAAFGPLDATAFVTGQAPAVPFLESDAPSGAFDGWYAYEGAPSHLVWSRYHVYLVRDGASLYKVQILGYYGERGGEPTSALYHLLYQDLRDPNAVAREVTALDGTAGGASASATAASECIDLATGARSRHTPDEARGARDWHLCVRRTGILVNGGRSGERRVAACNVLGAQAPSEALDDVKARTAATERARFDAVTSAAADGCPFVEDGVKSAFRDAWVDRSRTPPSPVSATWLVRGADGARTYLLALGSFEGASASSPGTVRLRVKVAP